MAQKKAAKSKQSPRERVENGVERMKKVAADLQKQKEELDGDMEAIVKLVEEAADEMERDSTS